MISMRDWERYITRLKAISDRAASEMQAYVDRFGLENATALINHAYALATKYGEAAGAAACEMYDAVAAASMAAVPAAEPAATATYGEVAKAINGARKNAEGQIPQIVGRTVKQAGADTTLKNAIRDGAQFAWVPHGDTCAFCITLASRGWQTASEKALKGGHAEHIHSNCDCEYAIRFGDEGGVRGYDPEKYKKIYYDADPDGSSKDRINAIRRQQYELNKDKINAQKREAYAKRKGLLDNTGNGIIQSSEEQAKHIQDAIENQIQEKRSDELVDNIIENHEGLKHFSPEQLKETLEKAGFDVKPLGRRSKHIPNVPFEEGGGYNTHFGGDGYLQYHPAGGRHKIPYWKIVNGKRGKHWYDTEGNEYFFGKAPE